MTIARWPLASGAKNDIMVRIWIYVLHSISTYDGEMLCQIILKSIGKCRSYAADEARQKLLW